ncbi:FAD-dependent monooxygenase [Streptosporangium sp. NPDC087985]|uniref:aromatic-ring hydroxylase C-terminal domain-containing protein n=1 Tax=Streptosporangium sp. NPDC087985 TaxID=3366196 RepID=UPI00380473CF
MDIPVLIVGGGPVGLCASIALSRFGVPSLLVERHSAASAFPKDRALSRTRHDRREVSTLDLVGTGFTLLTGPDGAAWQEAAPAGVPLLVHVGDADIAAVYGIAADGAVLIRPDDHVAWHCPRLPDRLGEAVAHTLATAFSRRKDRSPR